MHTNLCVLREISMEIGMLNFWVWLFACAMVHETHFNNVSGDCHSLGFYSKRFWINRSLSSGNFES